jgi:hypothetical protein
VAVKIMDFLLYVFASIGLTWIIVDSTISAKFKTWVSERTWISEWFKDKFSQLTSCYQCSGFWSGVIVGIIMAISDYCPPVRILLYGFASSWLAPLGYLMVSYLNVAASNFKSNDEEGDEDGEYIFEDTE